MPTPTATKIQIEEAILYAIGAGLSDDYNYPYMDNKSSVFTRISFSGAEHVGIALDNRSYDDIYQDLIDSRAYSIKMLDGALIQMTYEFRGRNLMKHRLAFFPSPFLEEFQNDPQTYLNDEIYADIFARSIVRVPVRFDYDNSEGLHRVANHPKSHLTLGQYQNCRFPVSAPLTPFQFVGFIVRNFYYTIHQHFADKLPSSSARFPLSIASEERKVTHVVVSL